MLLIVVAAPSCHQLVPFEEWLAPTRTRFALPPSTTFQRTRSQKNWLFKTHPEAFLGNLDLPARISLENRAQKAERNETRTGSLLAVGEIVDLKNPKSSRAATCPVIALAAGEAGHILQLSVINAEEWSWNDSFFAVGTSQAKFQGSWCSDGSPISKIEFAAKLKQYDPIRWLVVQKATSTTIFEPELRAKPADGISPILAFNEGAVDHIVFNPVATLTTKITSGEAHSDFSINLGSNDLAPQLAIIDRSGNWSVWYIGRDGHGRSRTTKVMPLKKGSWTLPAPIPFHLDHLAETHKIVWTTRTNRFDEWERDSSPSVHSDLPAGGSQATYLVDLDAHRPKYNGLLMCTHTQLQVLDIHGARSPSWLDFCGRDGMDTILDVQTFYGSSSHVFVLTTDKLHLLNTSHVGGQEAKAPHVLVSCRHFRDSQQGSLKFSVTKLRSAYGGSSALVSVHSAHNFRIDLFWFLITQEGTAKFHRQIVHFPELNRADTRESQGIQSLVAVPLHPARSEGKRCQIPGGDTSSYAHADNVQLCQLFVLTADLSLSCSIVALTQGVQQELAIPVKSSGLWWTDERRARFLRRKWLRETEQAFVVSDNAEVVQLLSPLNLPSHAERSETVQLRFYLLKLVEEINRAYAGNARERSVNSTGVEHFKPIRDVLKSREEDDHIALKPLLSYSDLWQPLDLSTIDDTWDFSLRRLNKSPHTQIFECGSYGPKQSVVDLFEKVSIRWSASLAADMLKASQWRYMELALERMAAEVYMSERGVYMVPQSTLDLASKSVLQDETQLQGEEDPGGVPSSQPRSSQLLPTPSVTPSSSRATSEAMARTANSQDDEAMGLEDPAVARLRMYLPSVKFTPPSKSGPSRVISLWPEQRGVDPFHYQYRTPGQGQDEKAEARQRRRERQEARRQRRAEKMAHLGLKMEGIGESYSQPYRPTMIRSSPPPQDVGSSQHQQAPSQGLGGFGFGSQSQSQSFIQGFGFSQTMSQPLSGEFGSRPRLKKRNGKTKTVGAPGFK